MTGPELLLRGDLENDRIDGDLYHRHRDAFLVGQVADAADVRVVAVDPVARGIQPGNGLHADAAARLVPDGQQRRDAGGDNVGVAAQQRVVGGHAAKVSPMKAHRAGDLYRFMSAVIETSVMALSG